MILVDSSVWIDFFRGIDTSGALQLREILRHDDVLVGDLILVEVLQGFRDEREAMVAAELLDRFDQVSILDTAIAKQAAAHYRQLRRLGISIRKTIDLPDYAAFSAARHVVQSKNIQVLEGAQRWRGTWCNSRKG